MSNGRGSLECCYCEFYRCHEPLWHGYDAAYEAGACEFYNTALPNTKETWLHRVCHEFSPNEFFGKHSQIDVAQRLSWFPAPLAKGILYGFSYNNPADVHPIATLGDAESA